MLTSVIDMPDWTNDLAEFGALPDRDLLAALERLRERAIVAQAKAEEHADRFNALPVKDRMRLHVEELKQSLKAARGW